VREASKQIVDKTNKKRRIDVFFQLAFAFNKPPYSIAKTHLREFEARMLPCITREDAAFNREYSYVKYELKHLIGDSEDADPGKPHGGKTKKDVARRIIMRSLVYHSVRS